jgi:hypothetical protein
MFRASWPLLRSDYFRTFVQYLSVGLVFVPAGAMYGAWVVSRGPSPVVFIALLTVGFIAAQLVWERVAVSLARIGVRLTFEPAAPNIVRAENLQVGAVPSLQYAFVAAITVLTSAAGVTRSITGGRDVNTRANMTLVLR